MSGNSKWGKKEWFVSNFISTKKSTSNYYDHEQNGYQRLRHNKIFENIRYHNKDKSVSNILDLGCGTGDLLSQIHLHFNPKCSIGVDFVDDLIEENKCRFPDILFISHDINTVFENEKIKDKKFDLILCSEVFYYLSSDQRINLLKNIHNICHEETRFILTSKVCPDDSQYFKTEELIFLMHNHFSILHTYKEYHSLFHLFMSPFKKFTAIRELADTSREHFVLKLYRNNALLRLLVNTISNLHIKISMSSSLPYSLNSISKRLRQSESNLTIVTKRKSL